MDGKCKELEKRVQELRAEITRKDEYIQKQLELSRTATDQLQDLLDSLEELCSRKPPSQATSAVSDDQYAALREVAAQSSSVFEQECRKAYLAWPTTVDQDSRESLVRGGLSPLEVTVTSLVAAGNSTSTLDSLRQSCMQRASELVRCTRAFAQGIDTEKGAALCGGVESVCAAIRALPVSSLAAVKRQVLIVLKLALDSQREIDDLITQGEMSWDLGDDDGEEHEEEGTEEISAEDKERLSDGLKALKLFCDLIKGISQSLTNKDMGSLQQVSSHLTSLNQCYTDFASELFPPHQVPELMQALQRLRESVEKLMTVGDFSKDAALRELHENFALHLSFIIT